MKNQIHTQQRQNAKDEIVREHERLHDLVAQIQGTRDCALLLSNLRHVQPILETHFSREEGPEGLYAILETQAISRIGRVTQLLEEHQVLLRDLRDLERRVHTCLEGPMAEIFRDAAALVERLRRHECRETELLGDAFCSEEGGLD